MEALLKERMRVGLVEQQLRTELEADVKRKTAHLMRAIEELQSEIEARKHMEAQVEESNTELFYATQQVKAAEKVSGLFHNMVNMLKSVNASAGLVSDQMKQSKIANVVRVGNLIREHAGKLDQFMANDPRGQKLPQYIAQLAEHLANEQAMLTKEFETIRLSIEEIMRLEQNHTKAVWQKSPQTKTATAVEEAPLGFISF
jgi:two-component system, NtrC family, sensor kinase